ncbi:MAG: lysine--tRNA ligase [Candidatus Micrarchaeota archaeon]
MEQERESEKQHWADKYAQEVIDRSPGKKEYIVETGITPSGSVHVGNFRETMTQDLVYRALLEKGVKTRYQYFWDDYDRFRKVPAGVDKSWEQYIGLPVCKVPDSFKCHSSYAEHYEAPLIEENKLVGIKCEYLHASKEYAKGIFADFVKTALEKSDEVRAIINKYREEAREEGWLPVEVYCEKCGKDTTTAKYEGGYAVLYSCKCGHSGQYDFRETANVKLRWRIDWPMRWAYYKVDFESSGKDHKASGGSWDTGVEICEKIFNYKPPIGPMYEFIYLKGIADKMSKSKGNVVTVKTLLEVYEPEVARYIYTARINKAIDMPFDADLLNIYNYYDEAENEVFYPMGKAQEWKEGQKLEVVPDVNEIRRWQLSQVGAVPPARTAKPNFSVCVNAIQIAVGSVEKAKEILQRTGHPHENAEQRLKLAWNWVQKYAPDEYKIKLLEQMPDTSGFNTSVLQILGETALEIERGADGEKLQTFVYENSKAKGQQPKLVFKAFYQLLLGKEKGPRLGPFLAALDKEFAAARLRLEK